MCLTVKHDMICKEVIGGGDGLTGRAGEALMHDVLYIILEAR